MDLEKALESAKKGHLPAQKYLYEHYKSTLFIVCLRYARDRSEAEDMLQEGFLAIFRDLKQFNEKGSLKGWMRRVMVNSALQYIRKWKRDWLHLDSSDYIDAFTTDEVVFHKLGLEELTRLVQRLPCGYRMVFNLFVIEGYNHKEIADLLNISVSTSKTQLFKAKAALKRQLELQLLT